MVKGGRASRSAAIGGAIGISYQRCGGQTFFGGLAGGGAEDGRIEAGGVVVGLEGLCGLAGGHRRPAARRSVRRRGGNPRLPDVGPGADDGNQRGAGARAVRARGGARGAGTGRQRPARASNRLTSSSLCAADNVTRRRLVPTGTVGGRMAGTHRPSWSSAADALSAACSLPSTTGMIGLGCPGGAKPASATRSISAARRPVRAAPSAERRMRSAARAAAASAGVGAVEKMYERARLTIRSTMSRDAATNPPSEPNVFDSVPTRTTVPPCRPSRSRPPIPPPLSRRGRLGRLGPRTAWASSRTRRALWRRQRVTRSSRGAMSPSMEKTESVTTMVGMGGVGASRRRCRGRCRPAARPGGPCHGGDRRRGLSGRAGTRR